MAKCFVAQPFDNAEFDERYAQVYEPAIKASGLDPYRVDRDPSASIPIDTIIAEIKSCSAVFVDISTDNPNVWFEFGLAIAYRKDVCIICGAVRQKFPFDVQHRKIIRYKTDAPDDFARLEQAIADRLSAIMETKNTVERLEEKISETTEPTGGLSDLELLFLGVLAGEVKSDKTSASMSFVYDEMEKLGYLPIGTSVAVRRLARRAFIEEVSGSDDWGNEFPSARVTTQGWQWIEDNLEKFVLRKTPRRKLVPNDFDDEIPF